MVSLLMGVLLWSATPVHAIELDENEFAVLRQFYNETGGANWTTSWSLGATAAETGSLNGVTISGGHVTRISLDNNNLQGTLPTCLFSLPQLYYISLSDNQLSGDLTTLFADLAENNVVTTLYLSHNQLTGNMYYLTLKLTALTTLYLIDNRIRDCNPVPPRYISTLYYKGQDLSDYMVDSEGHPICLSALFSQARADEDSKDLLPTILLLNTSSSSYSLDESFSTNLVDVKDDWSSTTWWARFHWRYNNSKSAFICSRGYNFNTWGAHSYYGTDAYRGELNAQIYAYMGWYNNSPSSPDENAPTNFHRFPLILDTPVGDVDFNCSVNLSDMQCIIRGAMNGYLSTYYITRNFTAANIINTDDSINIQDAVACIKILLDQDIYIPPSQLSRDMQRKTVQQQPDEASLAIDSEGRLVLRSTVPVAALEMQFSDGDVQWQSALSAFGHSSRGGHHVFYSLFDDELPAGTTILATTTASLLAADAVRLDGRRIALSIDQGVTSVPSIVVEQRHAEQYYDLQGRRVNARRPGIYIVEGKKVIK